MLNSLNVPKSKKPAVKSAGLEVPSGFEPLYVVLQTTA